VLADAGYWHTNQIEHLLADGFQVLVPRDSMVRQGARPGRKGGMLANPQSLQKWTMLGSNQRPPPCRGRTALTTEVSWSCGEPRAQRDFDGSALCRDALKEHRFSTEVCANCAQPSQEPRSERGGPARSGRREEADDLVAGELRCSTRDRRGARRSCLRRPRRMIRRHRSAAAVTRRGPLRCQSSSGAA
jgi:hypothetical protein